MTMKDTAIYAITAEGSKTAHKIFTSEINSDIFILEKYANNETAQVANLFKSGSLSEVINNNWNKYKFHIFIMATGIVVRKISNLLKSKIIDPAVIVCDEKGAFAISLISGHIGGGNRMTAQVANILNGKPVITTATDVQGLKAFDELASIQGWNVENPKNIKILNSNLLDNNRIGVLIPKEIYLKEYANKKNIIFLENITAIKHNNLSSCVLLNTSDKTVKIPSLLLTS